jgi:hypothetical protein
MNDYSRRRKLPVVAMLVLFLVTGMNVMVSSPVYAGSKVISTSPLEANISGSVYIDLNANREKDASEEECVNIPGSDSLHPGCAGVSVFLDLNGNGNIDPNEPLTTTDSSGKFNFTSLNPGMYTICEVTPPGFFTFSRCLGPSTLVGTVQDLGFVFGNFRDDPISATDALSEGCWPNGLGDSRTFAPVDPEWVPIHVIAPNHVGVVGSDTVTLEGAVVTTAQKFPLHDPHIRYVDANGNNRWDRGESVVYSYRLKYVDANGNNRWDPGETVAFDGNENGAFDAGELVIVGATPSAGTFLSFDLRIGFIDRNNNRSRDIDEPVVYDSNGNFTYDTGEPVIAGTTPSVGTFLNSPHIGILAGAFPSAGTPLKDDPHIKFVDSFPNGVRDTDEVVVYDGNDNGIYDTGEPIIAPATAAIVVGTPLWSERPENEAPSEVAEEDTLWTHYTHDKTQFVIPDPGYRHLVSSSRQFIEVEWDGASDMTTNGGSNDANDMTWGAMPEFVWPSAGDRVWVEGHWVFDCGHPGSKNPANVTFASEIHPPRAVVTFRLNHPTGNIPFVNNPFRFGVPDMPVTGLTGIPLTEADIFVSGNGGGTNDQCSQAFRNIAVSTGLNANNCFHTGPIIPISDRNYVFDIYPPGTDYTQRELNGTFKMHSPTRDGSGTDVSLQWRTIDRSSEIPAHAGTYLGTTGWTTSAVTPLLCPIDATTPLPTQTESSCPARPEHPTRLRVILPFGGTNANVFAQSILLGWDDVPSHPPCPATVLMPPASTPDAGRTPCAPVRTFNISLHKFKILQNGEGCCIDGDWRVFIDVGGQWRYLSGIPFEHNGDCNSGDSLAQDSGKKSIVGSDEGNGNGDCFRFDKHLWTVRVQDGAPIHVAVGGFESDQTDSGFCRVDVPPQGCDPGDNPLGTTVQCLLENIGLPNSSCMDDRIGTYEFDLNPPDYTAPGLIHVGPTLAVEPPNLEYEMTFTVQELVNGSTPTSDVIVGAPQLSTGANEMCSGQTYVTSTTPLTLIPRGVIGSNDFLGVQYRFYREGTPLPTFSSSEPFPMHWTSTGFSQTGPPRPIFLNNFDGTDGVYILQFSAQKATRVGTGLVVTDTEPRHTCRLILDNTAPHSTLTIGSPHYPVGSQQPFVTSATPFTVHAIDGGSGGQSVSYRFFLRGSTPPLHTTTSGSQAQFTISGPDGLYEIDIQATDHLGNVEPEHIQFVYLDNTLPVIALGGYYDSQEDSQHVIVALSNGDIQEVWWRSRQGVHQDQLAHFNGGIVGTDSYYDSQEDSQHVIVALSNGDIQEVWWRSRQGVHQDRLAHFNGSIVDVAGYYNSQEDSQHVIVALSNGDIQEVWWRSGQGVHQDQIIHFNGGIVGADGYYNNQENSQHVIVSLSNGDIQEVWWRIGQGVHQDQLAHFNGSIVNAGGYYNSQEDSQHAIITLSNSDVHEIWWRSGLGVHQDQIIHFNGGIVGADGYYNSQEDSQHVIVALSNGDIQEVWWRSGQGVHQDRLAHFNFSL